MSENGMNEINDVAPSSLAHLIGQRGVVAQVEVAIEAAFADGKKMDDCLLVGGPGLGKTQVAKVIAAELASQCHEVLAQAIECPADHNAVLIAAKYKDVVFL
jgi:Holliday junction DNA helicase RuvB